jgi:hypothetical protein
VVLKSYEGEVDNMFKGISSRQLISLLTLYLFIFMVLTGLVLYIVPPTRVARELQWTLAGISKTEYIRLHTILSFGFLVVALMHAWYNRSVLWRYLLLGRQVKIWNVESILAFVFIVVLLGASYFNVPPVDKIMSWGTAFKESWDGPCGGGQRLRQGKNRAEQYVDQTHGKI